MTTKNATRKEIELAAQSFEQMDGMAKYAQMMRSAMNIMRDHFGMTERALRMVQSPYGKQLVRALKIIDEDSL